MYKLCIGFGATIGGIAGSYAPMLFGETDIFSLWGIIGGVVGGIVGILLGYKLATMIA
jgi:gas vesicle protein